MESEAVRTAKRDELKDDYPPENSAQLSVLRGPSKHFFNNKSHYYLQQVLNKGPSIHDLTIARSIPLHQFPH